MKNYVFGADIGGTTVKLGLFTAEGELQDKWEIPTDTGSGGANILKDIAAAIDAKLQEKGIDKADVEGIGVGVPGAVDEEGVVNKCVNLGWGVVPVAKDLADLTGLPCKAGNDANVAAMGESFGGAGKDHTSALMITLGTGVGGGIIIDNQIVVGVNGAAGEIGHIHVNDDEEEACGCGNHGCLEQYCSATGIVRMAKKAMAESDTATAMADVAELTSKDVFDLAKEGDSLAGAVVEDVCGLLGKTIANIVNIINPAIVIIGGGVSRAGDILLDGVKSAFRRDAFHASADTPIVLATLGNDAGIFGGAGMIMGTKNE